MMIEMDPENLTLAQYQTDAEKLAVYPPVYADNANRIAYVGLGLGEEAGEVTRVLTRVFRTDGGQLTAERAAQLGEELGDLLWQMAVLATAAGLDLETIAQQNLAKLRDRQASKTLLARQVS